MKKSEPKTKTKSRKQQRKEMRKLKKVKRNEYYSRKPGQFVLNPNRNKDSEVNKSKGPKPNKEEKPLLSNPVLSTEQVRKKEQKEKRKIENSMRKQRNKQLLEANKEEDRIIQQLEKQLGLKKRKNKSLPKSFFEEGLDYLLEVCDPEKMKSSLSTGTDLYDNDFEEDFNLMTETNELEEDLNSDLDGTESDENNSELDENIKYSDNEYCDTLESGDEEKSKSSKNKKLKSEANNEMPSGSKKRKKKQEKVKKKLKIDQTDVSSDETKRDICDMESRDSSAEDSAEEKQIKGAAKVYDDGTWEDIYGRLRGKDGSVIRKTEQSKYVPPAARAQLANNSGDLKQTENIVKLRRQLKGYLNRLAESNLHYISSQIEELYMKNSRNDMNDTITNLMIESLITEVLTPERLLIEHIVLITILHANVGTEIGAHFLQQIVKWFDKCLLIELEIENKTLDNVVNILAQLYNFKIVDAKLIYDVLQRLAEKFTETTEKRIECILHILKSVGFTLRKDDPLALKNLILDLQKRAASVPDEAKNDPRLKFMLDVLLAIKNNNVTKIPNYDVSYSEHLKKILKGHIRKGNLVTQLSISLDDLLVAEEKGKWWVVGSAWSGNDYEKPKNNDKPTYSLKLLELAKKQRMNTDTRRNIFCIIMSAEDYLDAFEKILKIGLKNQQEREIINVILHCCLQEKNYNPYYAHLAQKFCDYDRKYQMIIKYSIWDKLKALSDHSGSQLSNLAKLLIHLFIEKGLPLSILKVIQFSDLDKITLRFMRQILIGILVHKNEESCLEIFAKVTKSAKLKLFRESLKLFIHHFLLRNMKTDAIPEEQRNLVEGRAKILEKALSPKDKY